MYSGPVLGEVGSPSEVEEQLYSKIVRNKSDIFLKLIVYSKINIKVCKLKKTIKFGWFFLQNYLFMKNSLFLGCFLLFFNNFLFGQKIIPNISIRSYEGLSVNIQDELSNEKITILSFWATWCVPCINELDAISDVYDEWQEDLNIELIAISTDDSRTQKRIKPMVNGKGWEYKILLDKNQELKRALNISAIPYTLVLKGNEIIFRRYGYSAGVEDELYESIKEYIGL